MQTRHDRDAAHFSATELFRKKAASRLEQAANTEKSVILDKKQDSHAGDRIAAWESRRLSEAQDDKWLAH